MTERHDHGRHMRPLLTQTILPIWLLAAALTLPLHACSQQYTEFEPALARFEEQIAQDVASDSVGSITAAVGVGNRVIWAKGFGPADIEQEIPAGVETIYRTGSISKSFTAVVLVRLAEQGVLDLDDPVVKYLPEFGGLKEPPVDIGTITLLQVASHTAGLDREPGLEGAAAGPIEQWEEKILASIPTTGFRASPGERYLYSNIGFGILGLTVSRAADKPFMDLVEDLIFKPLGMESSTFIIGPELQERLSTGYQNGRGGSINTEFPALEHAGRGYKVPNGGIYSTVGDLVQFMAGQTGTARRRILSEESRAKMQRFQTPVSERNGSKSGYGLGFSIRETEEGVLIVGHGGSVAGYTANMVFNPETAISVVLLRNYARGNTNLGGAAQGLLIELVGIMKGGEQ